MAMPLQSLVASPACCLHRASLAPVAQRNVNSVEGPVVSVAARQLASSASSQLCGSSSSALRSALTSWRQTPGVQRVGIRCEQGGASNSLDIWIGRAAMLGFVAAIGVEVSTGKGVLEAAGITSPVPTVALGITAVIGALTAFGVFRSTSRE